MSRVLLVEDDKTIQKGLKFSLEQEGFEVETVSYLSDIFYENIDIMILDIMLPDGDSLELFPDIRRKGNIPILFLTAIDSEDTIVKAFSLGVDDYITKPFRTRELIARLNRLLQKQTDKITHGEIEINLQSRKVFLNTKEVFFTPLEYKLLVMLYSNIGRVITREQILDRIYDISGNFVNDNTLTVYMKRIRKKIGEDKILTVKGIGYRVD